MKYRMNMKITKKNGPVVSLMKVTEDVDVVIITRQGKIIRTDPMTIRATGRSAQGVKVVNLEDGDIIAAAAVAPKSPDQLADELEEEEGGENGQGKLIQ